jgi:hypothetical protein
MKNTILSMMFGQNSMVNNLFTNIMIFRSAESKNVKKRLIIKRIEIFRRNNSVQSHKRILLTGESNG